MDRAEAIKILEAMATEMVGCFAGTISDNYAKFMQRRIDAIDMAIAALREQEKLESNREHLRVMEQGCEYCNEKEVVVMSANILTRDLANKGCVCWYCPMCGRKLTEPPKEGAEG